MATRKTVAAATPKARANKARANKAKPVPMEGTLTAKAKELQKARLVNIAVSDDFREKARDALAASITGTAKLTQLAAFMTRRYNFDWLTLARLSAKDAVAADKEHGTRLNVDRATFYAVYKEVGGTNPRAQWNLVVKYASEISKGTRHPETGKRVKVKGGTGARPGSNGRSDLVRAQEQLLTLYTWTAKKAKAKELDAKVAPIVKLIGEALAAIGTDPKSVKLS